MRLKYRFEMPDTAEKEEDDEPADPVFASFVVESWLSLSPREPVWLSGEALGWFSGKWTVSRVRFPTLAHPSLQKLWLADTVLWTVLHSYFS